MSNDKARMSDNPNNEDRACSGCGTVSNTAAIGDRCWRTAGEVSCNGRFQTPKTQQQSVSTGINTGKVADPVLFGSDDMLKEVALALERLRLRNPINGDGSNYMLDKAIKTLNVLAGNSEPGRAAEFLRAQLDDEDDARVCAERGWPWPLNGSTRVERLIAQRAESDRA